MSQSKTDKTIETEQSALKNQTGAPYIKIEGCAKSAAFADICRHLRRI